MRRRLVLGCTGFVRWLAVVFNCLFLIIISDWLKSRQKACESMYRALEPFVQKLFTELSTASVDACSGLLGQQ